MNNNDLENLHKKVDAIIEAHLQTANALKIQNEGFMKMNECMRKLIRVLEGK